MNFEVDFKNVKDKQDTILRLADAFKLHDISGHSWDAFEDYFTSLDPDSEIIRNSSPKPAKVHLVVKNIKDVREASEKDCDILLAILRDATRKENNGGKKIEFSFEII